MSLTPSQTLPGMETPSTLMDHGLPLAPTGGQAAHCRLALAPPHAARKCFVCITTPHVHRPLAGRVVGAGTPGRGARSAFYLTAPFTDVADVVGYGMGAYCSLFQFTLVPRWRWNVLEGCRTPEAAADRLLSIVVGRDESWVRYQKGVLAAIPAAA